MSRLRSRPAILVASVALVLATAASAQAQSAPITSPPSTDAPVTSPPTTKFLGLFPGTTVPPGGTPTTNRPTKIVPTTVAPSTTAPPAPTGDGGEPPPGTSKVVPPDAQRQIDSVRRTGPNNTTAWLAALQPLVTELGMTPRDAALAGAGRFPIAGPTTWVDDWLYPRYVPSFHLHKGLDMFAASGTPVRAPFDGTLRLSDGAVGGLAAYVTMSDGTYVYMAHLSAYASDKSTGQQVRQGDVVGFVGDTGNARGGSPHVHLQLHPKGGNPAPPKPMVDAWLADATKEASQVVSAARAARNPVAVTEAGASVTALENPEVDETAPTVDPAAALWAASSNPSIGTIDLASSLVATAAGEIAWPAPPG
jgi:hypothetical protein